MLEPDVVDRIRHIFLQPRPHVSISEAMRLLGWSQRQMSEAIEAGEVEPWTTPLRKWFPRAEMMAKSLEIWPLYVIEEALGEDADADGRRWVDGFICVHLRHLRIAVLLHTTFCRALQSTQGFLDALVKSARGQTPP